MSCNRARDVRLSDPGGSDSADERGQSIIFANQFRRGDSIYALDDVAYARENAPMKAAANEGVDKAVDPHLQLLVLERLEPSRNIARFYVLAIEPTLFGDTALVREWGRIGSLGRRRLDLHASAMSAREALDVWLARKVRRGYQIRALRSPS
jgi:predicted DNA-binding WGR domain protein